MYFKKYWLHLAAIVVLLVCFSVYVYRAKADFNANNLISDTSFVATNAMNPAEIQYFLQSHSSYLQSFSENGRSAAQIIYDASQGLYDAAGSLNGITLNQSTGTVNPQVILVTLQKEQSLISKTSRDDNALSKAMGYACPDGSGCNPDYAGFTKQVENAAWSLRYNYERLGGGACIGIQGANPSCVKQGDTTTMNKNSWDGSTQSVHLDTKATLALYHYTPHIYNGNYNFSNLFQQWFSASEFNNSFQGVSLYPTMAQGQANNFVLTVKNTGTATWQRGQVNLGTSHNKDRISVFTREGNGPSGWFSANRVMFQESSVAPGETATYSFWMRNDGVAPGYYKEYFQLVADGITWMPDYGYYWGITVP